MPRASILGNSDLAHPRRRLLRHVIGEMDEIAAHQPTGLRSVAQTRLVVEVVNLLCKRKSEFITYLVVDYPANAYPSWLGQGFEPRCDVDPVTINVAPVPDNVADIDAQAKLDTAIRWHIGVSTRHLALHFHGAPHCVNDTGKVAHRANVHSIVGTGRDQPWQLNKGRGDARSWTIHSWRS